MARQNQVVEVNSFVKGLITEASPLTFPENASLDEDNFNLRRDGSRDRRLGMDLEEAAVDVVTGIPSSTEDLAISTYTWENVGGVPSKSFIVVQTGGIIRVFNPDEAPISSGLEHTQSLGVSDITQPFSYANIDGDLVVVTGDKEINLLSYDGASFSLRTDYIKVRDQWGVEDVTGGVDLFSSSGISTRPSTLSYAHMYNLRNQTFGPAKERGGEGHTLRDTIRVFYNDTGQTVFPSNSDNINYVMYANPNNDQNRTGDQFYAEDLIGNPPGSFPAPKGHFIIDALERGKSRLEEEEALRANYPALAYSVANLPTDATPGGPRAVAEYSGRVWYAGFQGTVVDGDSRSPVLSSYIFYSQLVNDPSQIVNCYQEGDPTSKEAPDLLDTDGGFIRVDGAYNIQSLVSVGAGILVLAENGIWMISGGSDYGFSANNNMRRKISERGIQSPGSVVAIDNTVMFWADDGIYQIGPDQFGDYSSNNMTHNTIQKFYDEISPVVKLAAKGNYDSYDQKVRWVYNNNIGDTEPAKELIFDLNLGAFYTHTISTLGGNSYPRIVSPIEVPPFRLNESTTPVIDDGEPVVNDAEAVVQSVSVRGSGTRELAYMVITGVDNLTYSFARYRNSSFKDWESVDGTGVDAPAYLVTGYLSGGDFIRYKQAPYVQFYFTRTEDGFTDDGTGNLVPTNQSGCLVQAQWEWANSANSNRWGRTFQAYRYRRRYMPADVNDEFDNGFEVITTKNKLRGKGKVLSLKISTEPEKDCRLLGWSMLVGVTGNV